MAERDNAWENFLTSQQHEITRAFRELGQRWEGIFAQEALRLNAAVNHYEYGQKADGQSTHEWVSKPFEDRVAGMTQALGDMREATEMRLPWEAYSGHGSYMSGPPPERQTHDWMPERGTEAYVHWVVRDAIRTGHEEGYRLSADQIENIRQNVWDQELGPGRESISAADFDNGEVERAEALHDPQDELLAGRGVLVIDVNDPDMGARWQATLALLQARLEAGERHAPAQEHDQAGMGY